MSRKSALLVFWLAQTVIQSSISVIPAVETKIARVGVCRRYTVTQKNLPFRPGRNVCIIGCGNILMFQIA